tara:strand:+ start:8379 stop:9365 length:987 start_codon:yes stop_codon:yes gene_type:complete
MRIAIVGVTGIVGRVILEVLKERNFPITDIIPVASEKSVGQKIEFLNKEYKVISLKELLKKNIDIALFSAGSEVSKIWAPRLAEKGCKVIDNSSYWRMCSAHKLIIPEINGETLSNKDFIISSPNCSTIQLLMALAPLHKKYIIKRVIISTYQSISGTGKKALEQLHNEERNIMGEMVYPHKIHQNVLPHCDDFTDNGYTKEEMKLTNETKKILDTKIDVTATAVRVPVKIGHSESVNISFEYEYKLFELRETLMGIDGIIVLDNPEENKYPMPVNTHNNDNVYVGRIRRDFTQGKTLNMWIVADNLRKGAATNTVQIAEYLIKNNLI